MGAYQKTKRVIKRQSDNPRYLVKKVYGIGQSEIYEYETIFGALFAFVLFAWNNKAKKSRYYEVRLQEYSVICEFWRIMGGEK